MNLTEASLTRLAVHYTGNKQNGQSLLLSQREKDLDEEIRQRMTDILMDKFRQSHERYSFHHPSSLDFNVVYNLVGRLFQEPADFFSQSVKIASHLYEVALHPKIKPGELYIVWFDNIGIEDRKIDGIGLFKAENKSLFLDADPVFDDINLHLKEGAELAKIDKGCLILNQGADNGFELIIFDSNGKGEEAQYWKDKFLGVLIRQNEYTHTQEFLTITKNYVAHHMPDEFEVSKTEQIDILNRSMDYFKNHGSFSKEEFEQEVLHHDDIIQSFRKFDEQYRHNHDQAPVESFDISRQAVQKQARVFKSVIKLDKNFHIYVHGSRDLIEKGFDEVQQKHYYKIYFDHET